MSARSPIRTTRGQPVRRALRPTAEPWTCLSRSVSQTEQLGRVLGTAAQGGEVVALCGDLGAGKTALVRGLARGLGADPASVCSPTFVFIHEYAGHHRLAHADLYRIEQRDEVLHLGLSDYEDPSTVLAVEWAERAGDLLPDDRLTVELHHVAPTVRRLTFRATGSTAARLLAAVRQVGQRAADVPSARRTPRLVASNKRRR